MNEEAGQVSLRAFRPGDETGILDLFKRCYGHALGEDGDPSVWRWFYEENPVGRKFINLAVSEDRIVAQYAVVPRTMRIHSWSGTGTFSLHTMTDPAFQGRGLFTKLARGLYSELLQSGIPLTYGFPNSESVHGFVTKLGWHEIAPPPLHIFPLHPEKVLRARGLHPLLAGVGAIAARAYVRPPKPRRPSARLRVAESVDFPEAADTLWEATRGSVRVAAVRDREFLNWRFVHHPEGGYKIVLVWEGTALCGYAVLKQRVVEGLTVGFIMDLLVRDKRNDALLALMDATFAHFVEIGADAISCMMNPANACGAVLKKCRFVRLKPAQFPEEMHFGYVAHGNPPLGSHLSNFDNWYLTWADSDVI